MEIIGIIPCRFNSSRLPGKPLAMIGNKAMVCHVYDRASKALPGRVWVATDDRRIYDVVVAHGGKAVLTSSDCRNGTERCYEALAQLNVSPDVVVNIQGDEPFVDPDDIFLLMNEFSDKDVEIATLARKFNPEEGFDALFSPDNVKVTMTSDRNALYFSRSIIPYVRDFQWQEWLSNSDFFIHIGLYGFRVSALKEVVKAPKALLEQAESLEQLRWLSMGRKIKLALTQNRSFGVDTASDLELARQYYLESRNNESSNTP